MKITKVVKAVKNLCLYAIDEHPIITIAFGSCFMGAIMVLCPWLYVAITIPIVIKYII